MKFLLASSACVHAPASSLASFLSAYTAGASGAVISVQQTKDQRLVCFGNATIAVGSSAPVDRRVRDLTFAELRRANLGRDFRDWHGTPVRYTAEVASLAATLRALPADLECIIHLPAGVEATSRDAFVALVAREVLEQRPGSAILVAQPADAEVIRSITPDLPIVADAAAIDLTTKHRLDGIVVAESAFFENGKPTELAQRIAKLKTDGRVLRGALLLPGSEVPTRELVTAAGGNPAVWAVTTASLLATPDVRPERAVVDDKFRGTEPDLELWSFGYARVSTACHVRQEDGVHIDIQPYTAPDLPPPSDETERRLRRLEAQMGLALRQTPTYVGGGVGFVPGVDGPFAAEAEVTSQLASQATMVELAVTNVNPGRHLPSFTPSGAPRYPQNDHEKHAFFDPHGAPPFVGSEHDEDDGFRINSHFGSEYSDNNYGSDAGDGRMLEVSLRIERRGPYFATYYRARTDADARSWICSGVVRNDSMNARVFIRCAGKRWQKADPQHPGSSLPVVANHFKVSRMKIVRFPA